MYWRRSVRFAVAKSSAAALSKVSKPNVDCTLSRVFTPVFTTSKKDNSRLSSVDRCLSPCGGGVGEDDGVEGDPEGYEGEAGDPSENPDFIPFTETPIVRYRSSLAKSGRCFNDDRTGFF